MPQPTLILSSTYNDLKVVQLHVHSIAFIHSYYGEDNADDEHNRITLTYAELDRIYAYINQRRPSPDTGESGETAEIEQ